MSLTPDPDFATQVAFRIQYQCYYYVYCHQEEISPILFQNYGWFFDYESDLLGKYDLGKISSHLC